MKFRGWDETRRTPGRVTTFPSPASGERRKARRFRIEGAAAVWIVGRGKPGQPGAASLRDIGEGGARLVLGRPMRSGTRVRIHVLFPGSRGGVRMRFEGVVIRAGGGPGHEVAVRFSRGGQFVRSKPRRPKEALEENSTIQTRPGSAGSLARGRLRYNGADR